MNINGTGKGLGYINMGGTQKLSGRQRSPIAGMTFRSQTEFEAVRPFKITANHGFCAERNSISLVNGVTIYYEDGEHLKIGESSVFSSCGSRERLLAARGLDYLIRIANNQFTVDFRLQTRRFYDTPGMQAATIDALKAAGVDTKRQFYINGTPFQVIDGEIRRIHTRMGDFLNERGLTPLAEKYENWALLNSPADYFFKEEDNNQEGE